MIDKLTTCDLGYPNNVMANVQRVHKKKGRQKGCKIQTKTDDKCPLQFVKFVLLSVHDELVEMSNVLLLLQ